MEVRVFSTAPFNFKPLFFKEVPVFCGFVNTFATKICYKIGMEQEVKFPGLIRRGKSGIFQYRISVPEGIREQYGKREVNRSLGTSDEARAKEQYHHIAAEVQTEFNALRYSDEDAPQFEINPASAREHYDRIKSEDFAYRVKIHREAT